MIEIASIWAFVLTSIVVESTPGPNMGYLAVLSASEGRKAGYAATAGVALGLLGVGIASALGLTVIISNSPLLYEILRWGGVLYLIWLAWDGWKEASEIPAKKDIETSKFFKRGLITNLLNPKAAVFYIVILPTFINPNGHLMSQSITLTLLYVVVATIIHATIVTLAGFTQDFLKNPKRNTLARRIFSILLLIIALWLGWSTAPK